MSDLVSIILPVYNAEKYLERCLDSLINQTYSNVEIIIVNDGSSDNSINILEEYAIKDSRITIYHQKNKGLIESLNFLISKSKGKYIARMDADDFCDLTRIEKQVKIASLGYGIIGSNCNIVDGDANEVGRFIYERTNGALKVDGLFRCQFCHPAVFFNLNVIKRDDLVYSMEYVHAEDLELWFRLLDKYKGYNIQENLVTITRGHGDNVSSKYSAKQIENMYNIIRSRFSYLDVNTIKDLRQRDSLTSFIGACYSVEIKIIGFTNKLFFLRKAIMISISILMSRLK